MQSHKKHLIGSNCKYESWGGKTTNLGQKNHHQSIFKYHLNFNENLIDIENIINH